MSDVFTTQDVKPQCVQPRTQALTFARPKLRKDPGAGWSRGTQILGAKINCYSGRAQAAQSQNELSGVAGF